jgi:DNA-directed RNA polymerase subunit A'
MKIMQELGFTEMPAPDRGKKYSGKLLFSALLPDDLNLEYKTKTCKMIKGAGLCKDCKKEACPHDAYLKVEKGRLIHGVVDAASLGEVSGQLVTALAQNYSPSMIRNFYDKISRLSGTLITHKGMTVGIDEYETTDGVKRVKNRAAEEANEEAISLVKAYKRGSLAPVPGRTLKESFELKMLRLAAKAKDKVQTQLLKEKIEQVLSDRPPLNTIVMILSGSRGNPVNLTNISGFWGQASVREGRPRKGYKERLITLNQPEDVGLMAGGFIEKNFMDGMNAREFFYHSMGGRQGEVDTGVSTKISGYLYRRLANALKDLKVTNDGSVRTASQNLIQFVYGDDGIFPTTTRVGKVTLVDEIAKKMAKR